jgi:sialate O-acetylesterase
MFMRLLRGFALSPAALLLLAAFTAEAEVRLPNALSDHAVLQRDRPVHIWGWATPGSRLIVHFLSQNVPTTADKLGHFSAYLQPISAGGPYILTVSGDGADKQITDLLIGDLWLASGQSNMEFPLAGFPGAPLKDGEKEIAAASNPRLRLLLVQKKAADLPLSDIAGRWTLCTPETAKTFSAVAYFFGRELSKREDVPIGLIDSTWGGTPADSWTSMETLGSDPALLPAFASRAQFASTELDLDSIKAAERSEDETARAAGRPAPKHPWHPDEASWAPAGLYNGMIAPLTPLTIRGFIWYQGETNSAHDRAPHYGRLFSSMIADWRSHFAQGDLPFLYAQISSFSSPAEDWGTVRDQQRRTLSVANTAMAVTLDVGQSDNVHPPDKQTVAARLSLAARALAYGEHIDYSGPNFRQVTNETVKETPALRVWLDHAHGLNFHGKQATGFEIAGADLRFVPAEATIEGETVLVHAASVPAPKYVRYGWLSVVENNLYNVDGLPTSTFTSEPDLLH